jgi:hypothetical protein
MVKQSGKQTRLNKVVKTAHEINKIKPGQG